MYLANKNKRICSHKDSNMTAYCNFICNSQNWNNLNVHQGVSRLTNYGIFIQQNSTQQSIVTHKIMDEFQNNYAKIKKPDDKSAFSTFYFYKILEIANYNDSYG